jgi:adenosylcobinamide-phosphate synthase
MGRLASFMGHISPRLRPNITVVYGGFMVFILVSAFSVPLIFLSCLPPPVYLVLGVFFLKSTFSLKALRDSALRVKNCLYQDNLDEARNRAQDLVSRPTSHLDRPHLISATIESTSENACDSFVAPLFYFLIGGIPLCMAYRVVNTLDAMFGYHEEYEYLGKVGAKLDDILNFIPARISALLLVLSALIGRKDARKAGKTMLREHGKTESPNSGWTMSAAAGALRVKLEKEGYYTLGDGDLPLNEGRITEVVALVLILSWVWFLVIWGVKLAFIS